MVTLNFMFLLSVTFLITSATSGPALQLKAGSSLLVENPEEVIVSQNGVFSAGFYPVGENAYCFSVWFTEPSCSSSSRSNCTIVWMANRDYPVNGKLSKLLLQENGDLILQDAGRYIAWSTGTLSHFSTVLILRDTGNLVLQTMKGAVLWQSFDSPTNTLLPSQIFTKDMQLISSRSKHNHSSGFYKLFFNNDHILSLLYNSPEVSSIYWPAPWLVSWATGRFPYNSSRLASLDTLGMFSSSDRFSFLSEDYGVGRIHRRLTLDFDGNLRLYSRTENTAPTWSVSWQALSQPCKIHGTCGPNGTCNYDPVTGRKCSCLPGYKVKNTTDWSYGCQPEFNLSCDNTSDKQVRFIKLTNVEFYGNDYLVLPGFTLEKCKNLCSSLCNCKGFQYTSIGRDQWSLSSVINNIKTTESYPTVCYLKISLQNGYVHSPVHYGDSYIKVAKTSSDIEDSSGFGLNCSDADLVRPLYRSYQEIHENEALQLLIWLACGLGGIEILGILFVWCFLISFHKDSDEASQGYYQLPAITGFKRFTYSELKKATGNFSLQIGRGTGGTVYKGKLLDNRIAAIKKLNMADQAGEAQFQAEISIIGKLNHMNLIEIWGYCVEKKHRLLVYEYMEHGSLAENISSEALDWQKRYQIALGTARGLAYLSEECLERVLHCDVKPQSILLDSNYNPKVSDFGLSKLVKRGEDDGSTIIPAKFSGIRGTRGYMAPEWVFNLPITSKVDVYSYGIVLLEMVTWKCGGGGEVALAMQEGLVKWVRGKKNNFSWIEEIADPVLEGEFDRAQMELLVTVALQCVEEDRDARPTMKKVVEILLRHQNYL